MKRLLLLLAMATMAGCDLSSTEAPDNPSDPTTETYAAGLNIDLTQFTKTEHGVYYKDISVGTGPVLTGTPTIQFTYVGLLPNGTVFDSQDQYVYPLSGLIFGMQEGLQGMHQGGERMLVIPSALGYGNTVGIVVPPNSTTIFDVRLDQIP